MKELFDQIFDKCEVQFHRNITPRSKIVQMIFIDNLHSSYSLMVWSNDKQWLVSNTLLKMIHINDTTYTWNAEADVDTCIKNTFYTITSFKRNNRIFVTNHVWYM